MNRLRWSTVSKVKRSLCGPICRSVFESSAQHLIASFASLMDCLVRVQAHLGKGYARVAARSLSFLRVFAFVATPLRPAVSGVETAVVSRLGSRL